MLVRARCSEPQVVLPALLFKGMATLDLSDIDWALIAAMALGKLAVFGLAVAYALLTDNRPNKLAVAGVYAVFVTQSNDVCAFPRGCGGTCSCAVRATGLMARPRHVAAAGVHPLHALPPLLLLLL